MQLVTMWLRSNGETWINYERNNTNIPNDTEIMTMRELPDDILDKIKQESFEQVQKILYNYL